MGCLESKGIKLNDVHDNVDASSNIQYAVSKNLLDDAKAYLDKYPIESDILQHLSRDPSKETLTVEMAKFLISKGADVNCRNDQRYTPLHNAVSTGQKQLTKLLLEHGAKVHQHNVYNEIPLHHACAHDNIEIAELLLQHKSRVNEFSSFGTPLHEVCANEHPTIKTKQMCELLIKHGADVKLQCDVVLMPAGVDSTPQRKVGWTPLHVAYWAGNNMCAEILLQHGADKSLDAAAVRAEFTHAKL